MDPEGCEISAPSGAGSLKESSPVPFDPGAEKSDPIDTPVDDGKPDSPSDQLPTVDESQDSPKQDSSPAENLPHDSPRELDSQDDSTLKGEDSQPSDPEPEPSKPLGESPQAEEEQHKENEDEDEAPPEDIEKEKEESKNCNNPSDIDDAQMETEPKSQEEQDPETDDGVQAEKSETSTEKDGENGEKSAADPDLLEPEHEREDPEPMDTSPVPESEKDNDTSCETRKKSSENNTEEVENVSDGHPEKEITNNDGENTEGDDSGSGHINEAPTANTEDTRDVIVTSVGEKDKHDGVEKTKESKERSLSTNSSDEPITIEDEKETAVKGGKSDTKQAGTKQPKACIVCRKVCKCKYNIVRNGDVKHLCDDLCFKAFRACPTKYLRSEETEKKKATPKESNSNPNKVAKQQCCTTCSKVFTLSNLSKFEVKNGDIKPFCTEKCMQDNKAGKKMCGYCKADVRFAPDSIVASIYDGNYVRDFCSKLCHESFEKENKDIKIAGEKTDVVEIPDDSEVTVTTPTSTASKTTGSNSKTGTTKSVTTVTKPTHKKSAQCSVCHKVQEVKHEVNFDGKRYTLCGDTCFNAFRYANKLAMNECSYCGAHCFSEGNNPHSIQFEGQTKKFCSITCVNAFKVDKAKTVPCTWCQAKKNNFDMIERVDANNKFQMFCSLNCLSLYRVNLQATSNQSVHCDQCKRVSPAQYHLTMSDASVRNFCQYNCVMAFQAQFTAPNKNASTPTSVRQPSQAAMPSTTPATRQSPRQPVKSRQVSSMVPKPSPGSSTVPVISNVMSLAGNESAAGRGKGTPVPNNTTPGGIQTSNVGSQIIIQPPPPKSVKNKSLLCKPFTQTKATACRPHTQNKECQTDESHQSKPVLVPVPIPIYVPVPMAMYNVPQPYPLPIPIPVPVPFFVPTTKKNADSILKHIKEIQERMPADPFEAELLMMAEAVASAEKSDSSDESDDDGGSAPEPTFDPSLPMAPSPPNPGVNAANDVGEDMLSMALRMAEMPPGDEGQLDLEDSIQSTPISQPPVQPSHEVSVAEPEFSTIDQNSEILSATRGRGNWRGKRRRGRPSGGGSSSTPRSKKIKIEQPPEQEQIMSSPTPIIPPQPSDANMVLKYSFGVNAWKHWVVQKNAQLEKASTGRGRLKLFKTDILQCTSDELNYSLCLFVKEVRKPNGEEYAPDSIYYLCLGIQQYLFENSRIDNIFTDFYYEKFTECLNEILQRYEVRLNTLGLIVCRIEEEHLWESKQLGAHSPHVLLNTLVYFNTKSFMLRTAEEHIRLSFSHIMKHWKKTNTPGTRTPGRSVYLRYYAPVSAKENSSKRKREEVPVYEQAENVDNPLRCPVKLYEFYLSKCPESIRNRNDVFYLVPERSCVPDSPVWYSTASLGIDAMTKMLNRVRVVREIQMSHIHHSPMYTS